MVKVVTYRNDPVFKMAFLAELTAHEAADQFLAAELDACRRPRGTS
jgi:hypothetical protein